MLKRQTPFSKTVWELRGGAGGARGAGRGCVDVLGGEPGWDERSELFWRPSRPWRPRRGRAHRDLKERARALLVEGGWAPLFSARMVRTSRGRAYGCLVGSWGEPWRLYAADAGGRSRLQLGGPARGRVGQGGAGAAAPHRRPWIARLGQAARAVFKACAPRLASAASCLRLELDGTARHYAPHFHADDSASLRDGPLLESWTEPERGEVAAALDAAIKQRQESDPGRGGRGGGWRLW